MLIIDLLVAVMIFAYSAAPAVSRIDEAALIRVKNIASTFVQSTGYLARALLGLTNDKECSAGEYDFFVCGIRG